MNQAIFRFYAELNDFLPSGRRMVEFPHQIEGTPSVKDFIESLGVPHPEIDLILVNGESVDFSYRGKARDRIAVYPTFEAIDISSILRVRPSPLRVPFESPALFWTHTWEGWPPTSACWGSIPCIETTTRMRSLPSSQGIKGGPF